MFLQFCSRIPEILCANRNIEKSMALKAIVRLCIVSMLGRCVVDATVSMNYCSISCRDEGVGQTPTGASTRITGAQGKRGPIGVKGDRGPVGPSGSTGSPGLAGRPGEPCDCAAYTSELEEVKTALLALQNIVMSGWQRMSNKRWYKVFVDQVTYDQAKNNCSSHSAHLASAGIRDSEVRGEILDSLDLSSNVWIGLDDKVQEGRFMWNDNVTSTRTNTAWVKDQPDDWRNGEDCGHFQEGRHGINDASCSSKIFYLCETDKFF